MTSSSTSSPPFIRLSRNIEISTEKRNKHSQLVHYQRGLKSSLHQSRNNTKVAPLTTFLFTDRAQQPHISCAQYAGFPLDQIFRFDEFGPSEKDSKPSRKQAKQKQDEEAELSQNQQLPPTIYNTTVATMNKKAPCLTSSLLFPGRRRATTY